MAATKKTYKEEVHLGSLGYHDVEYTLERSGEAPEYRYYVVVDGIRIGWAVRWKGEREWQAIVRSPGEARGNLVGVDSKRSYAIYDVLFEGRYLLRTIARNKDRLAEMTEGAIDDLVLGNNKLRIGWTADELRQTELYPISDEAVAAAYGRLVEAGLLRNDGDAYYYPTEAGRDRARSLERRRV